MSLTGTPFFLSTIVFVIIALAMALALWNRIPGPGVVRYGARFGMLLLCQVTSIAMVFVIVNNANSLYDNWDDLLGTGNHVTATADLGADGGAAKAKQLPKVLQKFEPANEPKMGPDVLLTEMQGRLSGVKGEVFVWLPPQYNDPAYKDKKFPVVEVLPGFPGSAKAWFGTLHAPKQLKPLMQSGQVTPFILVAPRTRLLGQVDSGCANIPGKVNADTWLTVDVRQMIIDNFRADDRPDGWGIAGYSAGGHCAAKLALAHPDRYRAGVSMSGYNDPAQEPDALTGKDPELRRTNNPLYILKHAPRPPRTALYISGEAGDGYEGGLNLRSAAKAPTTVQVIKIPAGSGGHGTAVWAEEVPDVFRWLTRQIPFK